jgi:hypothetical protein
VVVRPAIKARVSKAVVEPVKKGAK